VIRILVVDDDEAVREAVADLVRLLGQSRGEVEVVTARDGVDAVGSARENPPDLVLMDVNMPGMDGVETFFELGRVLGHPPPTFFLSGYVGDGSVRARVESAIEAGATGWASKPIGAAALGELLDRSVGAADPGSAAGDTSRSGGGSP